MDELLKTINKSHYVFYTLPFFSDPFASLHLYQKLKNHHFIFLETHPIFEKLREKGHSVFCLKEKDPSTTIAKNSAALLSHPLTLDFIEKTKGSRTPAIFYFKPQTRIDRLIKEKKWLALNNPTRLQRKIENKFQFQKICRGLKILHPDSEIKTLNLENTKKLFKSYSSPLIIQSAHGWAGNNTFLLTDHENLQKHPLFNQTVKISQYIPGLTLINNAIVTKYGTVQSPPALQFTGLPGLTPTALGTCGRQWPAPIKEKTREKIIKITEKIGAYLSQINYRGFFGLDFQLSENEEIYLIEINPRLTASFSFYTHLELQKKLTPLLLFHLLSHLNLPYKINLKKEQERAHNLEIIGSELTQKLNSSRPQVITHSPQSGIYNSAGKFMENLDADWAQNIKKAKENFLVSSKTSQKTISVNSEYLKINKTSPFYDRQNKKIKPAVLKLNQILNEKFQFQKK